MKFSLHQFLIFFGLFGLSIGGEYPHPESPSYPPFLDYFGAYGLTYGYGYPVPPPTPYPYSLYGPPHAHPAPIPPSPIPIHFSPQVVFNDPTEWKPIPGPVPAPEFVEEKQAVVLAEKPGDKPIAVEPVAPTHKSYENTAYYNSPSNIDIQPSLSYGYSYKLVPTNSNQYQFSPTYNQPAKFSGDGPSPGPPVLPPAYYGLPPSPPPHSGPPVYGPPPPPPLYGAPIPIEH